MNNKIRHLELIQGIINRMAGNSFALKGWAVTLVTGVLALAGKETDKLYFLVAYIPIIVFWGLDSYYLLQERLYRVLYDKVRLSPDENDDFSMNTICERRADNKTTYWRCLTSTTELFFYFPLVIVSTLIVVIAHVG